LPVRLAAAIGSTDDERDSSAFRSASIIGAAVPSPVTAPTPGDRLVAGTFVPLASGFWRGPTAVAAWALTLVLAAAVLLAIGGGVVFSMWNRWFFDALEQRDAMALQGSLLALVAIVAGITGCDVVVYLTRATIQVRWRAWLTGELIGRWLGRQRYHHLDAAGGDAASVPEYRIADDVRWATEPVMDFYVGILGATTSILSFAGILWVVGGSITVGAGVTVPGYLALAGVLHAGLVVALMLRFGHTLPANIAARNEAEATFRLALMRVRENADSVALAHGEAGEGALLRQGLGVLARRWITVIRQESRLTWIQRGNTVLLPAVPLILAAPKYVSGELSLGAVMQLAAAYVPFQLAVAWAVENFRALSIWHASARRVGELIRALDELDRDLDRPGRSAVARVSAQDHLLRLDRLTLTDRAGAVLIDRAELVAAPGQRLLLTGPSGSGKSALARCIAGAWPWGSGTVGLPAGARVGFVASRAYVPPGTLRAALAWPRERLDRDDGAIVAALHDCGIGHLAPRLDAAERWDQRLSTGERQRLALARVVLQRPTVVILDDALAALDAPARRAAMAMLAGALPDAIVLSVAPEGSDLAALHDRVLTLAPAVTGARLKEARAPRLVAVGGAP
jgi:putative ATP-binding cassette transporter